MITLEDARVPLYLLAAAAAILSLIAAAAVIVSRQSVRLILDDPDRITEWVLLSMLVLGAFATGAFVTYVFFV